MVHDTLFAFGHGLQQLFLRHDEGRGFARLGEMAEPVASRNAHMRACYNDLRSFLEFDGLQVRYFFKYDAWSRCLARTKDVRKALGAFKFAANIFDVSMVLGMSSSCPHANDLTVGEGARDALFNRVLEESGTVLNIPGDFFTDAFNHRGIRSRPYEAFVAAEFLRCFPSTMDPATKPPRKPNTDCTGWWTDMRGTRIYM